MSAPLLVFTENFARGGGNRYMIDLANAVADDFGRVVFASNPGGIYPEDLARFSGHACTEEIAFVTRATIRQRVLRYGRFGRCMVAGFCIIEPLLFVSNVLRFCLYLRRIRPGRVLVCNGGYPAAQACLAMVVAANLCKIDVTLSIVSTPQPRRWHMWVYDWLVDRLVWRAASRVLGNAKTILTALRGLRGMPESQGMLVYNGIEERPESIPVPDDVRRLTIGSVARLEATKGVFVLLEAFAQLAAERTDVHLVLAGDGEASEAVAQWVHAHGLENRVDLLGHFGGDVDRLMRSFDVFAFPSLWEGFPYSILEALRAGCAIVSTDVGGIPEAMVHERDGLLVPPGDAKALCEALRLMTNEQCRHEFSKAARARFERDFSLQEMHRCARKVLLEIS